jgi:hypothetical protein
MTSTVASELTRRQPIKPTRFAVEDPATGEVITIVQGGGSAEINPAVVARSSAVTAALRSRASVRRGCRGASARHELREPRMVLHAPPLAQ